MVSTWSAGVIQWTVFFLNQCDSIPPPVRPDVAGSAPNAHTSGMTIKNAALLALLGMLFLTVLVTIDLFKSISGVAGGLIPAVAVLRSLIYWIASLSVLIVFAVFRRTL